MYFGCASVLQSIVTSVPDGAPTSWFGTNIIGETGVHATGPFFGVDLLCLPANVGIRGFSTASGREQVSERFFVCDSIFRLGRIAYVFTCVF